VRQRIALYFSCIQRRFTSMASFCGAVEFQSQLALPPALFDYVIDRV